MKKILIIFSAVLIVCCLATLFGCSSEFGKWEWNGTITKQFRTLDGKDATLAKDLYDIAADMEGSGISVYGVIDLREQRKELD